MLLTLDFEVTNIRAIIVEMDGSNGDKDDAVRRLILSKGFLPTKTSVRAGCKHSKKHCMKK